MTITVQALQEIGGRSE